MQKANVVVAGDKVYAGVDVDDQTSIPHAIVIQFKSKEDYAAAMRSGTVEFTLFEEPEGQESRQGVARTFHATADSVECPHCHYMNSGLLGNPRGKEAECDNCEKSFAIANDAAAVIN